eukprot:4752260-Pyramimonas_sp.AAC.1
MEIYGLEGILFEGRGEFVQLDVGGIVSHYFLNIAQHERRQEEIESGGPHQCKALRADGEP